MGFGLHVGWGIEGAIGSEFKIDASYLSPNVNLAARLEAASRQYGVPILISGELHSILSPKVQKICREIDTVTVKGSLLPMRLLTVTVHFRSLSETKDQYLGMSPKEKKDLKNLQKQTILKQVYEGDTTTWEIISKDSEFKELRRKVNPSHEKAFGRAYHRYIDGRWAEA